MTWSHTITNEKAIHIQGVIAEPWLFGGSLVLKNTSNSLLRKIFLSLVTLCLNYFSHLLDDIRTVDNKISSLFVAFGL